MLQRNFALFLFLGLSAYQSARHSRHIAFNWDEPEFHELNLSHTLSKASDIDEGMKKNLIHTIASLLRPAMADNDISNDKELNGIAAESRFELLDLNGDGTQEVIVQPVGLKAGCSATGNCPFWIFSKRDKGYGLLAKFDGVEMYRRELTKTKGYFDLAVASHDSASEKHVRVYQFIGRNYAPVACYDAWWIDTSGGKSRQLKRPRITSCPH